MKKNQKKTIEEISSIKDQKIILCRELGTSKGIKAHNKILLYGTEQIKFAISAGLTIDFVIQKKDTIEHTFDNYPLYETSEGILKKATDTNYLIPIIAVADLSFSESSYPDFLIVFDNVVDFGNIGTIIRTAQSFGIQTFAATNQDFMPFQRKVIDASRGTVLKSDFKIFSSAKEISTFLKSNEYQIVVTSPHARHLQSQINLEKKPIALIIGNETHGVSDYLMEIADISIQIPMAPAVESLNVGVAAGISLYELKFKQVLLMLKEKIFNNIGRTINVTGKLIQEAFDKKIRSITELTGPQVILLMIMHCDQEMKIKEIERDVALYGEELETFLRSIYNLNLIKKENEMYCITEKGNEFIAQIWPIIEQVNEIILKGLSKEEREILAGLLTKIQNNSINFIESQE